MEFDGKIHIRELEKKDVEVNGEKTDKWVQNLLARSAPAEDLTGLNSQTWAKECSAFETSVKVEKMGGDYLVRGQFKGLVPAPCCRCGDSFQTKREADFQVVMHRALRGDKVPEDTGDPDYMILQGDDIDLKEIIAEQLIVLEPVAECPEKDEKTGICRLCNRNPSFGEAAPLNNQKSTGQGIENSAFSALSKLDLGKKPASKKTSN